MGNRVLTNKQGGSPMLYFVKSPYWTRHYKTDTWWGPDRNGYTNILADAGVYTEEDKERMENFHEKDRCLFIPITQGLWEKGVKQLDKKGFSLSEERIRLTERYESNMKYIQGEIEENEKKYEHLYELAKDLGH